MGNTHFKILFLSSWYPNKIAPTSGIFVQRHAEAVAANNTKVAALHVCSDPNLKSNFYQVDTKTEKGVFTVNVYYRKVKSNMPIISLLIKGFRYLKAHKKGLSRVFSTMNKIDIVHHNILYPAGFFALFMKWKYKTPYLVTENWTGYLPTDKSYKGFIRKTVTKMIANGAAILTPVSEDLAKALKSHGFKTNYEIVPNVVDTNLFRPSISKPGRDKKQILHISTLNERQKNFSGLLRAIKGVSSIRKDFELLVITNGDATECVQYAEELNILNNIVHFEYEKSGEEIAENLRNTDFLVLFSNYENLPCVLLEALASGTPVISSKVGGVEEHITEEHGLLIDSKDEDALQQAINTMLDTFQNYDPATLTKYADDHFSYVKVGERFMDIYESIKA